MRLNGVRAIVLAVVCCASSTSAGQVSSNVTVLVVTDLGDITVAIDAEHAPNTAANFLRYVDTGAYDDGQFHRTVTMQNQPNNDVRIEVIQASVNRGRSEGSFDPIQLERTSVTGLRHIDGAISMARGGPATATSSFFFCIGNQPSLDFGGDRNPDGQGFAAFGHVVSGSEVIRQIQMQPADGQRLEPPIRIVSVARSNN